MNRQFASAFTLADTLFRLQGEPVPTPLPDAIIYGTLMVNGQEVMTATDFTIRTGDLLVAALLLVIAIELLAIILILQWRPHGQ